MNLLAETIEDIKYSGHTIADIVHIGNEEYGCSWNEFVELANIEYDNGFGAQEIAEDLIIVFSDGSTMFRTEYDGSENWQYSAQFTPKTSCKKIKRLKIRDNQVGWESLASLNKE